MEEARPGVSGYSVWKTGIRGERFTVTSTVDITNILVGEQLYRLYEASVGQTLGMVWANIIIVASSFHVVSVRLVSLEKIIAPSGGIAAGGALLRVEWTLLPILV